MSKLINKNREKYTVVPDNITRNSKLSPKGRGMLITLLSLPESWEFSEIGLTKLFSGVGRDYIRTCLKELENLGYLKRIRTRNEKGYLTSIDYQIFDSPQPISPVLENPTLDNPTQENPTLVQPTLEQPVLENPTQYITNELNTQGISVGIRNEVSPREGEEVKEIPLHKKNEMTIQSIDELKEYLQPFFSYINQRIEDMFEKGNEVEKQSWVVAVETLKNALYGADTPRKISSAGKLEQEDIFSAYTNLRKSFDSITNKEAYIWKTVFSIEESLDAVDSSGFSRREKRTALKGRDRNQDREQVISLLNILRAKYLKGEKNAITKN